MKTIDLFSMHLKDVLERIKAKKLKPKTKGDYLKLQGLIAAAGIRYIDTEELHPANFAMLMREIESRTSNLRTQRNLVASIKAVFNWAGPEGMNLCMKPAYGPRFKVPARRAIEAQQETGPSRFIDKGIIRAALAIASPKMKVAILLGINCGFYPSDTIAIRVRHLVTDHEPSFHNFRRVKTLQQRKAVLWLETLDAITDYRCIRSSPSDEHLLLLLNGKPHSPNADKLAGSFKTILKKIGHYERGIGLGSLRHTYATIIDTVQDQAMIDLTMGHTNQSIQKRTYRQLNTDEFARLQVLADTVHDWLFN